MKMTILMATYNGEKFLRRQLESIYNQEINNIEIYASDDGSTDQTLSILQEFQTQYPSLKLHILHGPQKGFVKNFLYLINQVPSHNQYYSFCDQDDVWLPLKLSSAILKLQEFEQNKPLLYCSRTKLINEQEEYIGYSPLFTKKESFRNALVQNIGGGNTMVFNQKTLELLKETSKTNSIVSHDWWTYLLVTGAGGKVSYSSEPLIHYRQHETNLIGSNQSLKSRLHRIKGLINGQFKTWNSGNIKELSNLSNLLIDENKIILNKFIKAKNTRFPISLYYYCQLRLYRQNLLGNLGLIFAIITNKI
jgi:glycosyltransferase involved in cell wall biosynthesis